MANLFELLTNIKNAGTNLFDRGNSPQLKGIQLNNDGKIDEAKSLALELDTKPLTLSDRLFGRKLEADTQKINPKTGKGSLVTVTRERPGLFDDISAGYRENRSTPIAQENFMETVTPDGRRKGWAYRIGEGLGSLARIGESPLGRSLLVGGVVGATGGNPLEMLTYGATTGMLNQANRMRDRVYRNELISNTQENLNNRTDLTPDERQTQLANISDQINNYRGYIDSNTYRNMLQGQQLRDNAAYRKMYFDTQQANQEAEREWRRLQSERELRQQERENRYKEQELALRANGQYQDYNLARQKLALDAIKAKESTNNDLANVEKQINNFTSTFRNLPNKFESYTLGNLRTMTGTNTTAEANFNSQRSLLFNQIARNLGGEKGVLSDQDIQRIDNALPKLTDSYEQKMAKMQAVYDLLNIKKGQYTKDPLGIR